MTHGPDLRGVIGDPDTNEYGAYFVPYVEAVRSRDPFALLESQAASVTSLCAALTETEGLHRYASGKWSVKETLGHLSDAERILAYGLFRISRGDATPVLGFNQGAYVEAARFDERAAPDLAEEFEAVRAATLRMIARIREQGWRQQGMFAANPMSARALLHIIPGHVEHHLDMLGERYGVRVPVTDAASRRLGS